MRIAMVHADLPNDTRGGVAHQVHHLANTLVARGHSVTFYSFSSAPPDARYQVRKVDVSPGFVRSKVRRLLFTSAVFGKCDLSGHDVVHYHGDNHFCLPGIPSVRTFYGSALDEALFATSPWRFLSQIVAYPLEWLGALTAGYCVGISPVTCSRVPFVSRIVPCGVDVSIFRPGPERTAHPSILFVGTTRGRKRGGLLARTFLREVRPRIKDAELLMVTDEPVVGPGITHVDRPSTAVLADLYRRSWIFCLPSRYEGFGIPYVEAMASGTPAVASPNPGARDLLAGTGVIVQDTELGGSLANLLEDRTRREEMGRKALTVSRRYSMESIASRYEAIYTALAAGRVPDPEEAASRP